MSGQIYLLDRLLEPVEEPTRGKSQSVGVEERHVVRDQKQADNDQEQTTDRVDGLYIAA